MPTGSAAATAAASLLSVACATRWQDASEWGAVVKKENPRRFFGLQIVGFERKSVSLQAKIGKTDRNGVF